MNSLALFRSDLKSTATPILETVRVILYRSPLSNQRHETFAIEGRTIAELVDMAGGLNRIPDLAKSCVVYLNGHPVPAKNWHLVRPKAGASIVVRAVVEGPIFAAIGAMIGSLAAAVSASTFLSNLLVSAVMFGASMLLNALFPVRAPQLESEEQGKAAFSLTSSRNTADPWGTIPMVFGAHRFTPPLGARPFTEAVGDEQYYRAVHVWTYGLADLRDIRIGETPLEQFQQVELQNANGHSANEELSLFPGTVIEEPLNIQLDGHLGWVHRQTATGVSEISVDILMPQGLYQVRKKDARKVEYEIRFDCEYKLATSPDWIALPQLYLNLRQLDALRRSFRVAVPVGQYDVRVKRSTLSDHEYEPDNTTISRAVLTAIRGTRPSRPITFDKPLLKSAIRIRADQQLNGSLDTLNALVVAHYQNIYDGANWIGQNHSRNPADALRQVWQGPANPRPIADAQIDFPALEEFWRYCQSRGYFYDAVVTKTRSVFDMVQEIAAAGRAFVTFNDGKWSVVWDEDQPDIVQMFTSRNSWNFEATKNLPLIPHGFKVRFINREKGFVEDERIVYDDGYNEGNATLFEQLEFPGVTDPHNIWKFGRFHLAQLRLRPETITLNCDWENLGLSRGDRVRVAHDVMLIGQKTGRVTGHSSGHLHLDEEIVIEAGKRYTIRFRENEFGDTARTFEANQLPRGAVTSLPWPDNPPEPDTLWIWGEAGRETADYRILSIKQNEDLSAQLTLVDDAPEISLADRGAIPAFVSNVTAPVDPYFQPPAEVTHTQEAYALGSEWFAQVVLSWTARTARVARFEVAMLDGTGGDWRAQGSTAPSQPTFTIADLAAGSYKFRVRSIFADGTFSAWTETEWVRTDVLLAPPPQVENFRINVVGDMSTLTWDKVQSAEYYEIRHCKIEEGVDVIWNSSTPIQQRISGTSFQVPTIIGAFPIKAVKGNGVRSADATIIYTSVASLNGLNVVETLTEPNFTGTKERVVRDAGGWLRLAPKDVDGMVLAELDGYYNFAQTVDLGTVYTSRLTASIKSEGADLTNVMSTWARLSDVQALDNSQPDEWGVEVQYRYSQDAPSANNWTEWTTLLVGDTTARAFQFRLFLFGDSPNGEAHSSVTPFVHDVSVVIDMPDVVQSGNDVAVPAAGRRITFERAFAAVPAVVPDPQSMAVGDKYTITNKDATGFDIRFLNSANAGVARTFDWVAKGYGIRG